MADEDLLPSISGDDEKTTAPKDEEEAKNHFRKKELQILLSNTEDLKTHLYEGGLKSWEGAGDLVEYLADYQIALGKGVLEVSA